MRWKLANGNVVASSKQPIRFRDFDRLVVDYIECDTTGITDQAITLFNPTTHTIRKCHNGEVYISITPRSRYIGQAQLLHLPYNYYKIESELQHGINYLSDMIDCSDFRRNGLRGDYEEDGVAYSKKVSIDRLMNPHDYDDYFYWAQCQYPRSEGGGYYYQKVDHQTSSGWHSVNDKMRVALWKGPCRKHGERLLTRIIDIDVDKNY